MYVNGIGCQKANTLILKMNQGIRFLTPVAHRNEITGFSATSLMRKVVCLVHDNIDHCVIKQEGLRLSIKKI